MAIKQLTPEQIRTMTLEEKDTWWQQNVYRGNMPQLTLRSGLTGMLLGGFLSLTNLYIGARTGWTLGVGITSVILSFALFKLLSRLGVGREMTVLENNAMQSIATAAGYVNTPLFASFAAYTMVTSQIIPMWHVVVWLVLIAIIGVLFAFPMKKRFINDEQLPFPEGMAAGVVMDALHESDAREGLFKAKLLSVAGLVAAVIELLRDEMLMRVLFASKSLPLHWDAFLYGEGTVARWLKHRGLVPRILGIELQELTIRWDSSVILLATGGLTGIRAGASMVVGGVLNYFILAPILIRHGVIVPKDGHYGFGQIVIWSLWGGVACMTTSSLYGFFSKPKVIIDAMRGLWKRGPAKIDVLADIELPMKFSVVGIPLASLALLGLGYMWFDVKPWLSAVAVPLVFIFSLIAVNATGLTSITPTGALGNVTQLTFGALAPQNITTNIMAAGITSEVSSNAANLLMDIKPGYMLGAKPRQQAIGHLLGGLSGLLVSVPVWYHVFIQGDISRYGTERLPVPGAITSKAVAELLVTGLSNLHPTARWAVIVGAVVGIMVEVSRQLTQNRFPLSAVGLGLSFVLSFRDIWTMFLGSLVFWMLERRSHAWDEAHKAKGEVAETPGTPRPWFAIAAANAEVICAGIIAGGALMGIGANVMDVLVLPEIKEAHAVTPQIQKVLGALR